MKLPIFRLGLLVLATMVVLVVAAACRCVLLGMVRVVFPFGRASATAGGSAARAPRGLHRMPLAA